MQHSTVSSIRGISPMPAHGRLAEAETCRRKGDLARAQSLCESLLKDYPDYVGALQTLGVVHLARKNFQQAFICFIQAVMHCPKDGVNLTNLATAYLRLGAREMAAQTLEQARKLNPNDAAVYCTLAEVYREDREYGLAAECYQQGAGYSARPTPRLPTGWATAMAISDGSTRRRRPSSARTDLIRNRWRSFTRSVSFRRPRPPLTCWSAVARVHRQEAQDRPEYEAFRAFTRAAALDRKGRHREAWTEPCRSQPAGVSGARAGAPPTRRTHGGGVAGGARPAGAQPRLVADGAARSCRFRCSSSARHDRARAPSSTSPADSKA